MGGGMSVEREPSRFRTRFMVRRPIDPARFSGTVVVHWNNVSLGLEYLGRLSDVESEVIASGSAWVGATVQKVGLDGLPGAEARGCSAGTTSATAPFPSSMTTPPSASSPRLPMRWA